MSSIPALNSNVKSFSEVRQALERINLALATAAVPSSRLISTTAPLSGGGDLSADRTLAISTFGGDAGAGGTRGVVPAPAAGDAAAGKVLAADGTWKVAGTITHPQVMARICRGA